MADETPNSKSDSDSQPTTSTPTTPTRTEPNRVRIKACELEVEAESTEMDVDEIVKEVSPEMERIMEYHLRGEYEVLEEQEFFSILLGGD